ncbi:MAG: acyl-CoA dehydrogenase family protein [Pseudomonadales bacterium]
MTQSQNFGFGDEEFMLKEAAAKFFSDNCPADVTHALVADNSDIYRPIESKWDKKLWQQIVDLGWTSVCVPESAGGIGMPVVAAVALAEEAGKAAFPSPLLATFNATFVARACESEAATKLLGEIAMGTSATLAITNEKGSWEAQDTDVTLQDGKLTGTAYFVQDAQKADVLVVSVNSDDGLALYRVDSNANGVSLEADSIIDLTRDQAHIRFDKVQGELLTVNGAQALEEAHPAILCITAADMVGSGEWLLQTTAEYARTRVQFDKPLGFFQAVKHPLVNVMLAIDAAKSLTYNAACAVDEEPSRALKLARMAKSAASDMAVFSSSRAVQFHGGIGFTWECFVHLFFKRQMHNHILYGDGKYQRAKLAEMLFDKAA